MSCSPCATPMIHALSNQAAICSKGPLELCYNLIYQVSAQVKLRLLTSLQRKALGQCGSLNGNGPRGSYI